MADKKVTELTAITAASNDDLLMVVNDPSGTPTSNKITFGNALSDTIRKSSNVAQTLSANLTTTTLIATNGLRLETVSENPATNNASTEGLSVGTIFFSNTHLYVVVSSTVIKRVELSVF